MTGARVPNNPFAELDPMHRLDVMRQRLHAIERQRLTGMWELSKRIHDLEAALTTIKTCMEAMLELLQREYGDDD